ncbi:MAG TPA: hypothetical protein VII99_06140 [Bacteroidia bacterium]
MTQVLLNESASVMLNASGNGTVKMGPLSARSVWYPANVHVSANANPTNEAQCSVYCGDLPIPANFRDKSVSGSSGDSSDRVSASVIKCGQYVYAVWTGGDANVFATLIVTGTKDI